MRKFFLLSLLLTLWGTATSRAANNSEETNLYALQSPTGTYFSFTAPTDGTSSAASFQNTPSYFYKVASGTGYTFEDLSSTGKYIGLDGGWNVGTSSTVWNVSEADGDGFVTISRNSGTGNLGHDTKWSAGGGIFTNVGASCNKWKLLPAYPVIIKYIYNEEVINTVKKGVFVGESFEINTQDMNVTSCTTNKGTIEERDGYYIPAVYGATEVTVTLASVDKYAGSNPTITDDEIGTVQSYGQYLTALALGNTSILSGAAEPSSKKDMHVVITDKDVLVVPGQTHSFTLTFPKEQTNQGLVAKVWMDKDGDGVYESLLSTTGTAATYNNLTTVQFTVPADATLGETRIRLRLDGAWAISATADGATKRMVYDIAVKVVDQIVTKELTYNFMYNGQKIGSQTLTGTVGASFPVPTQQFKVANELLSFVLPEGKVEEGTSEYNVEVSIKDEDFPTPTTITDGQFANDTKWYFATLRSEYMQYNGSTEVVTTAVHGLTDKDLFAVVGNPAEGYHIYNKALGASKAIYSNTPNSLNSVLDLNTAPSAGWSVTTNSNGGFSFYNTYNSANYYLHEKDDHLKHWSSESAKTDGGSNLIFEPAYEFTVLIGEVPGSVDAEAKYRGQTALANNGKLLLPRVDLDLFTAKDIAGNTWKYVVDESAKTISLVYTEVTPEVNPSAVVQLLTRIGGQDVVAKFKFVLDPSINSKQETFVLGEEDGKILIKGTTISALTTGIGWYLNNVAHINIAWNALNETTLENNENIDKGPGLDIFEEDDINTSEEGKQLSKRRRKANRNAEPAAKPYFDFTGIDLPLPTEEETHTSDAKYRYYLNTCTFGYSMTSWTWNRWQQEIDWMALHGINMPLQLVGLEEVWRTFLTMEDGNGKRKYGYTDEAAKAFVAGPAFIAWWAMNNLEGWGGTAAGSKSGYNNLAGAGGVQDDAWYARQKELAGKIVGAQRALGMQPVLPGWSGMVPTNFASKSGYATRGNGGNWAGDFMRPLLLNVNIGADKYAEIAADYYACLHEVMGESQYYSMDPFHEGGGEGTMEDYEALYAAMETAKSGSQWVIQQWQWSATQKYSLTAVPAGKLVVLDLFSDGSPAFDSYNGYAPQDAVFCAIPNFGGRSGLMGRLQNVTDNYFKFKEKYASIKGIGTAPEAIEQTPVTYDLIYQLPWMNGTKPNVEEWVNNYAVARYGQDNKVVKEAWSLLRQGPLNYGADGIQGPVEDVWAARPNLDAKPSSYWGKTINHAGGTYTKARRQMLIDAVYKLLDQKEALNLTSGSLFESNYNYDLVEFGGAVMADYAYDLLLGIKAAKDAEGTSGSTYIARRDAFLALIEDVDKFKGTNLNFRLGKWTQEARDAAAEAATYGATDANADWYEYNNARTIISTWSSPGTNLNDYSYRSWQGLMKDLYLPRWKYYFDNNCTDGEYKFFEWNWAHGMTHEVGQTAISTTPLTKGQAGHTDSYTRQPEGNTVEEATKLLNKYIIPVTVNGKTHYAYRYLDNDVSSMAIIPATAGATIDLTPYFGELTGISSFESNAVSGEITDLSNVAIKADATDGVYSATITLNDGTKLIFKILITKFNGVYTINYKNGNADAAVFIGYNEDKDNSNNVGYKLIATGTYSTTANGDKYFTITPSGAGFNISAQGKYLKAPNLGAYNHLMFSDNAAEAGVYLFEEVETNIFKMRDPSTTDDIKYVNDYDNLVFGNDKAGKGDLATFTLTEAKTFPLTITDAGMATLCLPFNVVMEEGMYAYDLALEGIQEGNDEVYECTMRAIAGPGQTLKAGTPAIIAADPDDYYLTITMSDDKAGTSLNGSLLKGNFVSQTLTQSSDKVKFIFANKDGVVGFYRFAIDPNKPSSSTIGANKCWLEWDVPTLGYPAQSIRLRFDDVTEITSVIQTTRTEGIYDLTGRRLAAPQKGVNIINGKKVIL